MAGTPVRIFRVFADPLVGRQCGLFGMRRSCGRGGVLGLLSVLLFQIGALAQSRVTREAEILAIVDPGTLEVDRILLVRPVDDPDGEVGPISEPYRIFNGLIKGRYHLVQNGPIPESGAWVILYTEDPGMASEWRLKWPIGKTVSVGGVMAEVVSLDHGEVVLKIR